MSQADLASLPLTAFEDVAALSARRSARWRPGLADRQGLALHNEIFASSREGAGAGAALALALDDWRHSPRTEGCEAEDRREVLWVQTREAARLSGRPYRPGMPDELHGRASAHAAALCDGLQAAAKRHGVPFLAQSQGAMFGIYFTDAAAITGHADVSACDADRFRRFFHAMLDRGVYFAPSSFEAGFASAVHGRTELDRVMAAADEVFAALR